MLKRNPELLTGQTFDLVIVGGGVYGAALAWEATLSGLSVALLEMNDFCSATSANSLKTIHGGLRYLQHADFKRMRESIKERTTLMRIAPHLVHTLPILVPTYGHGMKSRELMTMALLANDILSFDRNQGMPADKHIPNGYTISKQECLRRLPQFPPQGLTGAAIFTDAQVYNSERLVLNFLLSAAQKGAALLNYARVTDFLREGGNKVVGVQAVDQLTGDTYEIRSKLVINTVGPWSDMMLELLGKRPPATDMRLTKSFNVVVRPLLFGEYAVGINAPKRFQDADALIKRGSRLLFAAPWRGHSMIGTEYLPFDGDPDDWQVTPEEIQNFLDDFNAAYGAEKLTLEDVTFVQAGLLPAKRSEDPQDVQMVKHYHIFDHREDHVDGVVSVVGVKYTTARQVAGAVMDYVFDRWGRHRPQTNSHKTPLVGGNTQPFETFLTDAVKRHAANLSEGAVRSLVYNYGSQYASVLNYLPTPLEDLRPETEALALAEAQTLYGVHEEMAQHLSDIIFRRTELGSAGHPGVPVVERCAQTMAQALGWQPARMQKEIEDVYGNFPGSGHDEGHAAAEQLAASVSEVGSQTTEV
ncbi:MAG: glycerol-3-phosphate dehydrogenase/oxidase [Anaerolineae bacterium]|nr:glycerol-3-phosphate dehydrogenase/oxidase [Anaerolineae bacterium]